MKLRSTDDGLIAHDPERDRWVRLPEERDLLALRGEGAPARERAAAAVAADDAAEADPSTAGLPFRPRSMRAFMLWERHVIDSSRMLVKNFYPARAARVVLGFERLTGKPFPKLKPNARFRETPTFYVANHTSILADGEDMWWPSHTRFLDFELELACVLAKPLVDATPEEALDAVGGWFVLNDWSARDVQADDARRQRVRAGDQGQDVCQFDRLRCRHCRRGAGLDRDERPGARQWRALVRGYDRPSSAFARRDARLRVGGRAARRGGCHLHRHDAGLLRSGARPLDPVRPDRGARDRRDRHAHQPHQPDRGSGLTRWLTTT